LFPRFVIGIPGLSPESAPIARGTSAGERPLLGDRNGEDGDPVVDDPLVQPEKEGGP
jgi:hypothetical protein